MAGGSFVFEQEFDTKKDAVEYLKNLVEVYGYEHGTEEQIREMYREIKSGTLTYDAVTAYIERV